MASIPRIIGSSSVGSTNTSQVHEPTCHPYEATEATVLFILSGLGIVSNVALILLVCIKKPSKRYHQSWSQGLLLHQGLVDLGRALLLVYLGVSVLMCERLSKCFLIDTAFLLLVSVSTVNMLTMLINDAPIFPEHEQLGSISACVAGAHRLRVRNEVKNKKEELETNLSFVIPLPHFPLTFVVHPLSLSFYLFLLFFLRFKEKISLSSLSFVC
jgi:hypothetical protein